MTGKKSATIRKWVGTKGWGIANAYLGGSQEPQKYFVHVNNAVSQNVQLGLGIRILFVEGPPRNPGELPVALEIEVASLPSPVMCSKIEEVKS